MALQLTLLMGPSNAKAFRFPRPVFCRHVANTQVPQAPAFFSFLPPGTAVWWPLGTFLQTHPGIFANRSAFVASSSATFDQPHHRGVLFR